MQYLHKKQNLQILKTVKHISKSFDLVCFCIIHIILYIGLVKIYLDRLNEITKQ